MLIKYLVVGVINTVIGYSIIFAIKWYFGAGDIISNLIGYCCGITLSFYLNKEIVFGYNGDSFSALVMFLFVVFIAYLTNLFAVLISIHLLHINSYISQVVGVIPYTLIGYVGSRFFVFSNLESHEVKR